MLKFKAEQIAIYPPDPVAARKLLSEIGAQDWSLDHVKAEGTVFNDYSSNEADLAFNYQLGAPSLEFEILSYTDGPNWMDVRPNVDPHRASHIGMHCSAAEIGMWKQFFRKRGIGIAQEVRTNSHTNPMIAGKRRYHYVIFDTHPILGIDLKFIVRLDLD